MKNRFIFAVMAMAAATTIARAETIQKHQKSDSEVGISSGAVTILSDLYRTNAMEIDMGKMAMEKGKSKDVRNYGQMLVNDHEKSQQQVMQVAKDLNIDVATMTETMNNQKMTDVHNLSGAEFDRQFVRMMAADHQKAIDRMEAAQKNATGQTADLIAQTLPVLRNHKKQADQLVNDVGSKRGSN